jgi:hypothetical protein
VHRDPLDLCSEQLHVAGVDARPQGEAQAPDALADGEGATDRAGRSVEERNEAVAGPVQLAAAVPSQLLAHDDVVFLQLGAPAEVPEAGRVLSRSHDIGEEDAAMIGAGDSVPVRKRSIGDRIDSASPRNGRWSPPANSTYSAMLRQAKLPPIRFHDLRHTFATLQLAAGTNPKIVSEVLRHKEIAITLDRYSHALPTMQATAMARLDAILGRGDDAPPVAGSDKGSNRAPGGDQGRQQGPIRAWIGPMRARLVPHTGIAAWAR